MEEHKADVWQRAIYAPYWTRIFYRIGREKYGRSTDGESLAEDARQRLALSLDRLVTRPDNPNPLLTRGYILTAFRNALVDAFRELHGRPAPRQWLVDLGALGLRLFDLYCLMRLRFQEILETLRGDAEFAHLFDLQQGQAEARVTEVLREMLRRRECAGHPVELVSLHTSPGGEDDDLPDIDPPTDDPGPQARLENAQVEWLRGLLYGAPMDKLSGVLGERLREALGRLGNKRLHLEADEAFILRCFRDGIPERRVGELLGGLSVRQVRYRHEGAIAKLQELLRSAGISYEDLLD